MRRSSRASTTYRLRVVAQRGASTASVPTRLKGGLQATWIAGKRLSTMPYYEGTPVTRNPRRAALAWGVSAVTLLSAMACTNAGSGRARNAGNASADASADVVQRPVNSDATATAFLEALRADDFVRATSHFSRNVRRELPAPKLADVWKQATAGLGVPGAWTVIQRSEAQGMDVRTALLTFENGSLLAVIVVHPDTHEMGGLWFRPAPPELVQAVAEADADQSAAPAQPARLRSESISLGAAPFVLSGTLTLPLGGPGRFPAVVLVHGSGPHDRDATVGPNKPFRDLAEGLAERGVAVLRYDKRTFSHGAKLNNGISLDEEVILDAAAAIDVLRRHPEVDLTRLYVLGHSLGAQLAPEIAMRAAPIAGVVLLAPPGRPPWDILVAQMRYLELPVEQLAKVEGNVARLKAGSRDGDLLGAPASYWLDLNARDGVAMAKKLGKPMLILHGERDYQITTEDLTVWKQGLAGISNIEFVTVPAANHLFIKGSGKPGPAEYSQPGHVEEMVLDKVSAFVKAGG